MTNDSIANAQAEVSILRDFSNLMQKEGGYLACIGTALSRTAKVFDTQQACIEQMAARIAQLEQNSK